MPFAFNESISDSFKVTTATDSPTALNTSTVYPFLSLCADVMFNHSGYVSDL